MVKLIISLAMLASIFLAKTVTSQGPYCVCRMGGTPSCVPGPPPKDLKQGATPQCYCNGPYYPVCSGWKEANVTSELDKILPPSEVVIQKLVPPPPPDCICPAIFQPVCACETREKTCRTFGNQCELNCAQRSNPNWCFNSEGECGSNCVNRPPAPSGV